ncbi:MAG: NADH-quinone oxidoreductase subunit NuoE [Bryobacterales bacterium]|nr:NADH-quinone oxidoreductase subunit NuoE [Bryobacterales bacterium]MBV9401209.1 NADH-quinone oxidoreductase subunit NuoE [Bryobacterales bacterium]
MLTAEEIGEIEHEAKNYPVRSAVTIDALQIVQRHRGWVSDEAIQDLANHLGVSKADLDSVASFYNLIYRHRVGRHVIHLCDSVSCWVMGYRQVREELEKQLGIDFGGTTADSRFTFLPVVCLGCCDHAPAMLIDGDLHTDLSPGSIANTLERYL